MGMPGESPVSELFPFVPKVCRGQVPNILSKRLQCVHVRVPRLRRSEEGGRRGQANRSTDLMKTVNTRYTGSEGVMGKGDMV